MSDRRLTPMQPAPVARRMAAIAPFRVMELLARAKALEAQGRSIVHMEIGEPDFPSPQPVVDAAMAALQGGDVHYTPALGLPELRTAIAGFYRSRYGIEVASERIAVTPGASGALLLALAVLLDPGAELLLPDPCYPCNRQFAYLLDARPVSVPVGPETAYQLTPHLVDEHWTERTAAVMLASPSNPAGTMVPREHVARMAAIARSRGGTLIMDEIYHGLVYGEPAHTALECGPDVFVINSFSKYFHMTGWRLGWLVVPERLVGEVDKLAQNIFLAAPTLAQRAALACFRPETLALLEQRKAEFQKRRDFLVPALRELGFGISAMPKGAFYVYADASRFTQDSLAFCRDLLEQAGVAATPGVDFGAHDAQRHVRFAYTRDVDTLREGVARIGRFLGNL